MNCRQMCVKFLAKCRAGAIMITTIVYTIWQKWAFWSYSPIHEGRGPRENDDPLVGGALGNQNQQPGPNQQPARPQMQTRDPQFVTATVCPWGIYFIFPSLFSE